MLSEKIIQLTLLHQDAADGASHVVVVGVTSVNHETVAELHRLGSLATQLTTHNDLATTGTALHNVAQSAVARTTHAQATEHLVAQRLSLGNGAQTALLYSLGVQLNRALLEAESLLDHRCELSDSSAFLAEHRLRSRGHHDDLGHRRRHTHLHTTVTVLGQLTCEKSVQLSLEHTITHKLQAERREKYSVIPVIGSSTIRTRVLRKIWSLFGHLMVPYFALLRHLFNFVLHDVN